MYLDQDVAALFKGEDGGLRLGVFFYLGLSPTPLRLWCGVNDVPLGIPSVDPAGSVYLGAGQLMNVPELELLINGIADRVDFYLSGTDPTFVKTLAPAASSVLGAPTIVGVAPLDVRYQPQTPIIGVWTGAADLMKMSARPGADPTAPGTQTVTVSCGTGDTSRARPRLTAFSQSQQHLISPTDNFFSQIVRYVQQFVVSWPNY
jgi:hypothetical protein